MTRKISIFLAILLLMSQLLSTPVNVNATESNGVTLVDESNVYQQTKFYQDSLFGVAGGFHLVGLNSVKNNVHINGNILTDKLIYGSDFGTSGVAEATYIRKIESGSAITVGGHEESILVLGEEVEVSTVDNGNAWSVNGNKVNRPNKNNQPNQLWQDGKREFIDLNQVEQHVVQLVSKLAKLENSSIEINNRDHNKQEIIISNDNNFNVYNLKKDDFSFSTPIHIKGFEKNKASTLIINVDMSQMDNKNEFIIPNSVAHYTDGSSVSIGHVTKWSNANVVWNIYDSSNASKLYTGTIKNSAAVTGSILAPKATVILDHNLNGTVIAEDIIINGETHRDDYVNPEKDPEPKTTQVAVEKLWEGKAQDLVTINLLANGTVVDSVDLSDSNNWQHVFTDLSVENEQGPIEYTVEEVYIDGYETTITGEAESGFIVTNIEIEEPEEFVEEDPDEEPEDDKKVVPEKKEIDKSSNESGKLLPSTATNVFNLLLIGFVLLLVSGLGYYLLKKKRTE
ncbi:MAG TPA: Cna B-type domain-containing protein [Bacilli bacterium]|nr:Cna B-type domain-containing protein [Bacilli bacterium]